MMTQPELHGPVISGRMHSVVCDFLEGIARTRLDELARSRDQYQNLQAALDQASQDGPGLKAIVELWRALRDVAK